MNQKELIWIDFPYSNFTQRKIRPALIVSNNKYNSKNDDLVVCALTSNNKKTDYSVLIDNTNISQGKLAVPSKVKADKIMQINKKLALKSFAKIKDKNFNEIVKEIKKLITENPSIT